MAEKILSGDSCILDNLFICTKCSQYKLVQEFSKDKYSSRGIKHWCKECCKVWRQENRELMRSIGKKYRESNREKEQERQKIYRSNNKSKIADRQKIWKENNLDRYVEYYKQYYILNREEKLEKNKKYRQENLEYWREKNRRWAKNNPLKHNEKASRRRALVKGDKVDYQQILDIHKNICHLCNKSIDLNLKWPDPMALAFEHIIPLAKNGKHAIDNIKPSHNICNWKKGDRI